MARKTRSGVFKNDGPAIAAWGEDFYRSIPKSVFALVAWHLANVASNTADAPGAAATRFAEEWQALFDGGHLTQRPGLQMRNAIRKAHGDDQ